MKVFAVPSIFLLALLALYGAGRFTFSLGQLALGKSDEIAQIRARQNHLLNAVKAALIDGRQPEAQAMLTAAENSGTIQFFSLRRDDGAPLRQGLEAAPIAGESVALEAEAGPYVVGVATHWSWTRKASQAANGVVVELAFLAGASLLLVLARAYARKKRPARRATSVRILREVGEVKLPAPPAAAEEKVAAESDAFECSLLRLQVGSTANSEETLLSLAPLLEVSRRAAIDACARYGGKISYGNGHEFLCYFPDSGDGHSSLLALSAARDLRHALKSEGVKIGMHYSLAHGFARLLGGAEKHILGAPVLELNRLPLVATQILATERLARFAAPTVKFKAREDIIAYSTHVPLTEVLQRCQKGSFAEIDAYHSDEHLLEILGSLREGWTAEAFVGVVGQLRRFSYQSCGPEVARAFKELFRHELGGPASMRLSALITLAANFFSRHTIDQELYGLFVRTLSHADRRVKSNSIELFIQLYPREEIAELRGLAKSQDNRISANVLIKRALEKFDEKVVSALYGRVRGGSVAHVASALFALGEIAQHYKAIDPAQLRERHSFLRLFDEIPYWTRHPNCMVRRQALFAAKKLGDPILEAKLKRVFEDCADQELLVLFESIFGWKKDDSFARRSA